MRSMIPLSLLVVLMPAMVRAQDIDAPPDLLRGLVPYAPGPERSRFQQAAGVDNELAESEFAPGEGFARPFEKWAALKIFDANNDGRLDWFEADAYRRALRDAVIAMYDANRNGRLDPDERAAANRDLAAGKVPPIGRGVASATSPRPTPAANANPFFNFAQPGAPGQLPPQLVQMLDTDGDGQISAEERIAAYRNFRGRGWDWAMSQYDRDGDGVLSAAERSTAPGPVQFMFKLDDLVIRDFDEDGDGQLSDAEYAALDEYFQRWMQISQENTLRFLDTDGDGQVSPAEQAAFQAKAQGAMFQMLPRVLSWADRDGDGQASQEEWLGLFDRFSGAFDQQMDRYTRRFDSDGDGRLNAVEREALIQGLQEDDRQRIRRHDRDGDGQLSVTEMLTLFDEAAAEWGVKPADTSGR